MSPRPAPSDPVYVFLEQATVLSPECYAFREPSSLLHLDSSYVVLVTDCERCEKCGQLASFSRVYGCSAPVGAVWLDEPMATLATSEEDEHPMCSDCAPSGRGGMGEGGR
jgi:hypothetical protein